MEILPNLDRLVSEPIKSVDFRVGRLSPQAAAIRKQLIDPMNTGRFLHLHRLFTVEEEHRYLESYTSAMNRERRLQDEYQTKVKPSGWQTTDPLYYNPDNFRYIVHTTTKARLDNGVWWSYARKLGPERQYSNNEWQVLLDDFLTQTIICCTLVDEIHRGTYLQGTISHGFILEVPEENILAVDPFDRGTQNHIQDNQKRGDSYHTKEAFDNKLGVSSAQEFFNNGVSSAYNEVVVDGIGTKGRQVRISGIFLIVDPVLGIPHYELNARLSWSLKEMYARLLISGYRDEENYYTEQAKRLYQDAKDLAQHLHVPIINIPAHL